MKFGRGSSRHLVIAACLFDAAEAMEQATAAIRALQRNWGRSERWEFKYSKTSDAMKAEFFHAVSPIDFRVRAIVIDKPKLYSVHLRNAPVHLHNYAITQLLSHADGTISDAKLVIDGQDVVAFGARSATYFQRAINTAQPGTLRKVAFEDSARNPLIQLADMVAGAIHRSERGERDARAHMAVVTKKIAAPGGDLWRFG